MVKDSTEEKMATLKADLRNLNTTLRDFTDRVEKSFGDFTNELKRITDLTAISQVNTQRIKALEEKFEEHQTAMDKRMSDMQSTVTWAARTIIGAVILGVLALVFQTNIPK